MLWGGCSSAGRAVRLVIGRLLVQIPAPDVHLAPCMPASAISEGPAMSWRIVQGVPCPRPETQKNPRPHKRDKAVTWMEGIFCC